MEITRVKNRIRIFFDYHDYAEAFAAGDWTEQQYADVRNIELSPALKVTLHAYFAMLDNFKQVRIVLYKSMIALTKKERYKNAVRIIDCVAGVGNLLRYGLCLNGAKTWERDSHRVARWLVSVG